MIEKFREESFIGLLENIHIHILMYPKECLGIARVYPNYTVAFDYLFAED